MRLPGSGEQVLVSQYADDTAVVVSNDPSMAQVLRIYGQYQLASGAKINIEKSCGLCLGPLTNRVDTPFGFKWSATSCKSLGIHIGDPVAETTNFERRLQKLTSVFLSWRQRRLSLQGKSFVANALTLSGLFYVAASVPVPDWVLDNVTKQCWDFLWSAKTPLVSRAACIQPREKGGLLFPDFRRKVIAFHAVWVRRFLCGSTAKWTYFFSYWLRRCLPPGGGTVALCNLAGLDCPCVI